MAGRGGRFRRAEELGRRELEEGESFAPRFDADGLVTAVAVDADSGEPLMVARMNAEALGRTIDSGEAWYWSRSRGELWHKGATSGQIQRVVEIRVDCDQDALLLRVRPQRPGACHVGYRSCFFRSLQRSAGGGLRLRTEEDGKVPA